MGLKIGKISMFLLSVIGEHVHKKVDHNQEEYSLCETDDGCTNDERGDNGSCAQEYIGEETEIEETAQIWFELQTDAIENTEAINFNVTQEDERSIQQESQSEEVQSEEIESEESSGEMQDETAERLLTELETEAEVISEDSGNPGDMTDNTGEYNSEYTEIEIPSDDKKVELFLYTQTENDPIEMTEGGVYVLPETGGTGTCIMELSGYLCIFLALLLLLIRGIMVQRTFKTVYGQDTLREDEKERN